MSEKNDIISERIPNTQNIFYIFGMSDLIEMVTRIGKDKVVYRPISQLGVRKTLFLKHDTKLFCLSEFAIPCKFDNEDGTLNYDVMMVKIKEKNLEVTKECYSSVDSLKLWVKENLPELKISDEPYWKYATKLFKCIYLMKSYK